MATATRAALVHRAEQALLGALIRSPSRRADLRGLLPQDFADQRHQVIFAALTRLARQRGRQADRPTNRLTSRPSTQVRDIAAYMAGLPGLCPEPGHLASYAAIVAEVRERREARGRARRDEQARKADGQLAGASAWLAETATSRRRRTGRDSRASGRGDIHPDIARLAGALRASPLFRAQSPPVAARAVDSAARVMSEPAKRKPRPWATGPATPPGAHILFTVEHLQDQVLADLMCPSGDGRFVAAWLPARVFAPGPRRDLYELIRIRLGAGKPVDPLIIAWEADLYQRVGRVGNLREAAVGESMPELALRLGTLDIARGTATVLGQALLADHFCAAQFGPDWARSVNLADPANSPSRRADATCRQKSPRGCQRISNFDPLGFRED